MIGLGALAGLLLGIGLQLLVTNPTPWRGRRFLLRVQRELHPRPPRLRPLERWVGAARMHGIAQRQQRTGVAADPSAYLLDAVVWCAAGLAAGGGIVAVLMAVGSVRQPAAAVMLMLICMLLGWMIHDRRLDTAARRRQLRAALDLPNVAETLGLAVAAGAALPHALELLVRRSDGVLVHELAVVVDDIRDGLPIDRALAHVCERLPVLSVTRFIDGLRIALERGTPIVDVLHSQASDARNETRRLLLEQAGRREIAMLLPVVFFVLPCVVVVALYPGFTELGALAQ